MWPMIDQVSTAFSGLSAQLKMVGPISPETREKPHNQRGTKNSQSMGVDLLEGLFSVCAFWLIIMMQLSLYLF